MGSWLFLVAFATTLFATLTHAEVVEKTFVVGNTTIHRLCGRRTIVAINGQFPGPTIEAREGDNVIIHVINESPYDMTIHWHGIFQIGTPWADGPNYVTQCPIKPGNKFTYNFNLINQVGTLWYHAHVSFLRATVYGALIIRPSFNKGSKPYPFPKPYREIPILLGEWWNGNVVDMEADAIGSGAGPNISDAYTINGKPGDLYPCSDKQVFKVNVTGGKRYLLRVINAALENELFFKVAGHKLTVVGIDATYTTPYHTNVLTLAPGQTVDAILVADAPPASYYMAARPYSSSSVPFDNTTTVAILRYSDALPTPLPPMMPVLPEFNDTPTAHTFYTNLTALVTSEGPSSVPLEVDEHMFITIGMGLVPCDLKNKSACLGPFGMKLASSMNNISYQRPKQMSLLQAHAQKADGVFTLDFPDRPAMKFDYTSLNGTVDMNLLPTTKATKLKRLRFNSTVEIVLQNTALLGFENHPIHLHGYNFFVLAQGFGNYHANNVKFNLVNPQERNTIAVPTGGWAVIRFLANNPGVWIMHCHLDFHLPVGLATAFVVENGPTSETSIPPPPYDYPQC